MALTFETDINPDGNLTRTLGTSSVKWKLNGYLPELIEVSISASPSTSVTVSNSNITEAHTVINEFCIHTNNIEYTTGAGSITVSCADGIPAMTLYLGIKI